MNACANRQELLARLESLVDAAVSAVDAAGWEGVRSVVVSLTPADRTLPEIVIGAAVPLTSSASSRAGGRPGAAEDQG